MLDTNALAHSPYRLSRRQLYVLAPLTVLGITSTALFLLTLLIGVWAAYDWVTAFVRCLLMVVGLLGMVGIAWHGRYRAKTSLGFIGVGCALGAAVLSLAYILHLADNSGAVASGLMVLLPLASCGAWWQWNCRQKRLTRLAGGALSFSLLVFLLTVERTAWIGLGSGIVGAGYIYWRFEPTTPRSGTLRRISDWGIGLALCGGLMLYLFLFFAAKLDGMNGQSIMGSAIYERAALWRESLALCRDYYFTGSGLGMTAMIYSTYVLAVHVPYWYHAHQLYLQIALEQGVLGLIAFLGMTLSSLGILVWTYRVSSPYSRCFCLATITALLAIFSYGLLDAELYATALVTVLFLPLGFTWALYWSFLSRQILPSQAPRFYSALPFSQALPMVGGATVMPVIAVLLCLGPGIGSKLYTNLGVVAQTKAELSLYRWPRWSIQDELRQRGIVDLGAALTYYQKALTLDPANATVHQRLGQLALSQQNYSVALAHLRLAYKAAPDREAIHRLLGEAYAVTGHVAEAAALWQTVSIGQGQMEDRLWWYGSLQAEQEVRWLQQALMKSRF